MGRLLGLMLFCIGIGMVIGMLIAESVTYCDRSRSLVCFADIICFADKNSPRFLRGEFFKFEFYALSTFPDLRQEVHTYIFLAPPVAVLTFTDFTLDFHILLDLLWE